MAAERKDTRTLTLRVVSPVGLIADARVASATLPGLYGDFTVLPEHHDTVAQLGAGIARYTIEGKPRYLSILGGVATVQGDRIEVCSPVCELAEEIDEKRAREAQRRAEERLAEKREDIDIARAQAALSRALLRLEAARLTDAK
jgi:F-type H+-transporting ATPase subunit epsilon